MLKFKTWLENNDWANSFDQQREKEQADAIQFISLMKHKLLPLVHTLNSNDDINTIETTCKSINDFLRKANQQFSFAVLTTKDIIEELDQCLMYIEMVKSGTRPIQYLKSFTSRVIGAITDAIEQ